MRIARSPAVKPRLPMVLEILPDGSLQALAADASAAEALPNSASLGEPVSSRLRLDGAKF